MLFIIDVCCLPTYSSTGPNSASQEEDLGQRRGQAMQLVVSTMASSTLNQKRRKLFSTGGAPSLSARVRQGHAYNIATVRSFAGGARAPGAPPLPPPMSTAGYWGMGQTGKTTSR